MSGRESVVCFAPRQQGRFIGRGEGGVGVAAFAAGITHTDHMPCKAKFFPLAVFGWIYLFLFQPIPKGGGANAHGLVWLERLVVFQAADSGGSLGGVASRGVGNRA